MVPRFKHFALVLDLAFLPIILNNLFIRSHSFSISKIYFYYKKKWKLHSFIDSISDVLRNSSSQNLQGKSLNSWLKIIIRNTNVRLLFLNLILYHCNCSRLTESFLKKNICKKTPWEPCFKVKIYCLFWDNQNPNFFKSI